MDLSEILEVREVCDETGINHYLSYKWVLLSIATGIINETPDWTSMVTRAVLGRTKDSTEPIIEKSPYDF